MCDVVPLVEVKEYRLSTASYLELKVGFKDNQIQPSCFMRKESETQRANKWTLPELTQLLTNRAGIVFSDLFCLLHFLLYISWSSC